MQLLFYITALVALVAAARVITGLNAVHALLHLVVSLLAIALLFFMLGAPFAAALEIIIYAGAIMVLMVFAIMMLNQGEAAVEQEKRWLPLRLWRGPALLAGVLLTEIAYLLLGDGLFDTPPVGVQVVDGTAVGRALFDPYLVAVELAAILLLAALVGSFHLSRKLRERGGRLRD